MQPSPGKQCSVSLNEHVHAKLHESTTTELRCLHALAIKSHLVKCNTHASCTPQIAVVPSPIEDRIHRDPKPSFSSYGALIFLTLSTLTLNKCFPRSALKFPASALGPPKQHRKVYSHAMQG